ncbi:SPOSA6832_02219, partial [Sporobolomyces salmonicolor]
MPPKRKASATSKPSKRMRSSYGQIGARTAADDTARMIAAHHLAEHAGGGGSYLAVRSLRTVARSLRETSLEVAAKGLYEAIRLQPKPAGGGGQAGGGRTWAGWDTDRDPASAREVRDLSEYVQSLPEDLANRLLGRVLDFSSQALESPNDPGVSVLAIAALFFHPNTTRLSLSALSAPAVLISRLPQCTGLVDLNLSSLPSLKDTLLSKVLAQLPTLEKVNLKGCTKVGDASLIALSKATEHRLKVANLSLTAVTVKGLTSVLARCSQLEVLKLAAVAALNEKNVNKLVEVATGSTQAALGWRHVPLSHLRTLKLRQTDITDASLGRLLSLCATTLTHLDVSYSALKSLDIVSSALHTLPSWKLEKLVVSGLPLTSATMEGFFQPLSERPAEERARFKILKIGSIPASSTKAPGLTDAVLSKLMPYLVKLEGLVSVSLFQNWGLGKAKEPMRTFIEVIGRRCRHLDLTLSLESYHLEGLLPPLLPSPSDPASTDRPPPEPVPPRLETLVLDSFLATVLDACPHLSVLNLTSCRGVPVTQRRTFFDAWENGEVVVAP